MALTPNPSPGSWSHYLSDEDVPGEGRLPKDASLDLHLPLRFRAMRGGSRQAEPQRGAARRG